MSRSNDSSELGGGDCGRVVDRAGPGRTASGIDVQDVAPGSGTAMKEQGRPGMNGEAVFARP